MPVLNELDDNYSKVKRSKSRMKKTSYYYTIAEKKEIMSECNEQALILIEYMMDSKNTTPLTDEAMSNSLGWSKQKIQRTRLMLEEHGYFCKENYTTRDGKKLFKYYIGKEVVSKVKGS